MRAIDAFDAELCATLQRAVRAQSSASAEAFGARRSCRCRRLKPARLQPIVPLRSATTLFGSAGIDQRLRADDAARAAGAIDHDQRVGRRRDVVDAQHQFGARHIDAVGIETREYSSNGRLSSTTMSVPLRISCSAPPPRCSACRCRARRSSPNALLGTLTPENSSIPGRRPGRDAAVENGNIAIAVARQNRGGALGKPSASSNSTMRVPRRGTSRANRSSKPAQRHRARQQQMAFARRSAPRARRPAPARRHRRACAHDGRADARAHPSDRHVACCGVIWCTSPVFRSKRTRLILSRLVPVTRTKRAVVRIVDRMDLAVLIDAGVAGHQPVFLRPA